MADSQEMKDNVMPLFSRKENKKSQVIESKAFLKSIFNRIPDVLEMHSGMISEAVV